MSEHKSNMVEFDDSQKKWSAQQVGVNSDTPLKDDGVGANYIIRQFLFSFNPDILQKIADKKIPIPSQQELFNSNWFQIKGELWKDGLVAVQEKEFQPKIVIGKRKYKIILTCQPRMGVMLADKANTLQDVLKPQQVKNA